MVLEHGYTNLFIRENQRVEQSPNRHIRATLSVIGFGAKSDKIEKHREVPCKGKHRRRVVFCRSKVCKATEDARLSRMRIAQLVER